MYVIKVPEIEPRLQKRYRLLVEQHLSKAESVAAGLRALPQTGTAMSAAHAAYRFYANRRVTLPQLAAPLLQHAQVAATACRDWALVLHDWSPLHYTHHPSKDDRIVLYNKNDFGYLLQTALLISDQDGAPLCPLYLSLAAADGVYSTRREKPLPARTELDELGRTFGYVERQALGKLCVHIVDRQADSVLHLRRWARRRRRFLIRGNDVRRVEQQGQSRLLSAVEADLRGAFQFSRQVEFKGQKAEQYVAETQLTLAEPARPQRQRNGKLTYRTLRGRALPLRFILVEVRDAAGRVLATWRLWTNLPAAVEATTVALWYYWRWRIESFFKLLKRAGQQAEQWQQESAAALAKRLLVAAQALVIVWALMQTDEAAAVPLRQLLIRLSGRLMKRGVAYTAPALLAGLWNLLAIQDALDHYSVAELREMGRLVKQMLGLQLA